MAAAFTIALTPFRSASAAMFLRAIGDAPERN
jgi:hypothetical protein